MKRLNYLPLILILLSSFGCTTVQYENENARIADQIAQEYTIGKVVIRNALTLHTANVISDSDLRNLSAVIDQHKASLEAAEEALLAGDTQTAVVNLDVVTRLSIMLKAILDDYWEQYYESSSDSATGQISD